MKKIGFVFAMVLGVGCGGGDKVQEALKGVEGYKAKVCACKEKACADKEVAAYEKWKDGIKKSVGEAFDKMDKAKAKEMDQKFDDLEDAMEACAKKFEGGGDAPAGDTPPAADTPK